MPQIRTYYGVSWEHNGETKPPFGSTQTPIAEVTSSGVLWVPLRAKLLAEQKATAYNYSQSGDFSQFAVRVLSEDLGLYVSLYTDIPDVNGDASGANFAGWTHHFWVTQSAPLVLPSRDILTLDDDAALTVANLVSSDGQGLPAIWANTDKANGKIYSIALWNPSADEDVEYERLLAG